MAMNNDARRASQGGRTVLSISRRRNTGAVGEPLEGRILLAASLSAKTGLLSKFDSNLVSAYQELEAQLAARSLPSADRFEPSNEVVRVADGNVAVELYANPGAGAKVAAAVRSVGAPLVQQFGDTIDAAVPLLQLPALLDLQALRFGTAVAAGTGTGSVNSQGDTALRASNARATYAVNGSGVKVGVLSDSFNNNGGYATNITTGDLPNNVQVLQDMSSGGTDEGRAMLQIVNDLAPGSPLAYATAFLGQASFASNINSLRTTAGCKVICDDVYYFAEPFFQDGVIAQAVDSTVAAGVSYFSLAGNFGRKGYESAWRSGAVLADGAITSAAGAPHFYGGTTFDFDPGAGVDNMQSFTLASGASILLSFQWDSPFFSVSGGSGSSNDCDVYVLNSAGTQVVGGATANNAGGDAVEVFSFQNTSGSTQTYQLMLTKFSGANPTFLKYIDLSGGGNFTQFATNSGTIYGHFNAAGAQTVGAAWYQQTPAFGTNPPVAESYSSGGTTPILFTTTGVPTGPVIRNKPDITATDGVSTTVSGFGSFFGTSAATPHAAAIAALMYQANPAATIAQLNTAIRTGAIDMSTAGYDTNTGWGLIQADAAVAAIVTPNGIWDGGGDGVNWSDPINWSNNVLPGASDDCILNVAANPTINVTGVQSVKSVTSSEILNITGTLNVTNASTFNTNVSLSGTLGGTGNINVAGGTFTWSGGSIAGSGSFSLASAATLSVIGSGTRSSTRGFALTGQASLAAGGNKTLVVPSLSITSPGKLDLNDNDLVVDYTGGTPLATIRGYINTARSSGTWLGATGITSTSAKNNAAHNTTLGLMEATEYDAMHGGSGALFDGIDPDATAVLVKYTYYGDATFDGRVTFDDYVKIDTGFNAHSTGWVNGDFNGDGTVNFDDYVLIDIAFNTQSGTLGRGLASGRSGRIR